MTINDEQIVDDLERARRVLVEQREELDARIGAIEHTIATFMGVPMKYEDRAPATQLSVGDDKLEEVRLCLKSQPDGMRQADVVEATGLNSGTVSVALRRLQIANEAKPGGKERGSTVWQYVHAQVPCAA